MPEWLNSPDPYVQYCYDADPRLVRIIELEGFAFDDESWYWIPKSRVASLIVKRAPLWTYPCKSVPAEKSRKHRKEPAPNQKRLV